MGLGVSFRTPATSQLAGVTPPGAEALPGARLGASAPRWGPALCPAGLPGSGWGLPCALQLRVSVSVHICPVLVPCRAR